MYIYIYIYTSEAAPPCFLCLQRGGVRDTSEVKDGRTILRTGGRLSHPGRVEYGKAREHLRSPLSRVRTECPAPASPKPSLRGGDRKWGACSPGQKITRQKSRKIH